MPQLSRTDHLDAGFDAVFLDRWLHYEKYAWGFIVLFLLAGLSGILGRGALARTTETAAPDGLRVKYERVARNKTPAVVEITLPGQTFPSGRFRLQLRGDFVKRGRIERIVPQPVWSEPIPGGLLAEFVSSTESAGGSVTLFQQPSGVGLLRSSVAVDGEHPVEVSQIVLP